MRTRNNKLINFIFESSQILLVFLGVYSALMCLALGLELPISRTMCTLIMFGAAILFYALFTVLETFPRGKLYGIAGLTLFYGVLMIRFLGAVQKGAVTIINSFLKQFMNYSGADLALLAYKDTESAGVLFCTTLVVVLLGVYLTAIISAFFYRRRRSAVFVGLTLPFVILPLLAGRMGYFSNMFTYLAVLVTVVGTRHLRTDATDRRMRQKLSFIMMGICLVAGLAAYIVVPPERYERNENRILEVKNSVVSLTSWSPDEILSAVKAYFSDDAIDYGRIGKRREVNYTGKTMIKISGVINSESSLYLKGYVGDVYQNNRWSSLQNDEDYQKDLAKLQDNAVTLENWHVQLRNEVGTQNTNIGKTATLRIRNIAFGYGNYLIPYMPTNGFSYQLNGRAAAEEPGLDYTSEYYLHYADRLRSDVETGKYNLGTYSVWDNNEAERQNLKEFAEKYYLQIPDTLQSVCDDFDQFVKKNYSSIKKGNPKRSDIIAAVKDYIMQDTEYTLSPGKTPAGKDTVDYFLNENKKGYCVYYATAAAILLRSYGVPARYVEGMYISKKELSEVKAGATAEVDVPDRDAHAWVEVYDEKYGFVPIEVTPGFEEESDTGKTSPNDNSSDKKKGSSDAKATPEPTGEPDDGSSDSQNDTEEKPLEVTPTPGVTAVPQEDMIFEDIDHGSSDGGNGMSSATAKLIWRIVKIVGIVLLIAAVLEGQRRIRRYIFRRNLKHLRMKKRIHMVHSHLSVLLAHKGVLYHGQTVAKYTREISAAMEMPYDKIYDYVALVFRASYGPDDITEEDMAVFRLTYENIRRKAYENAKLPTKLYYMYIMVL